MDEKRRSRRGESVRVVLSKAGGVPFVVHAPSWQALLFVGGGGPHPLYVPYNKFLAFSVKRLLVGKRKLRTQQFDGVGGTTSSR